jgi:putative ABC transport system permease protein
MAMQALRARPDAILVSAETARDYSIVAGDRIRVRVPNAQGVLIPVDFSMAGVALEFPTAPRDAFLVANLSYVATQTNNPGISFVLARADGDLAAASSRLAQRLGSGWIVTDLRTTSARLANSITSVNLSGLVLLDIGFAVLIGAVGVGLFLLAGLAERRREFATLVAVGAESAHVRASVIGETLFVGAAGIVVGVLVGTLIGAVLVQILAGVFDPPANLPVVPVAAIGAVIGAVLVGLGVCVVVADRAMSRLDLVGALRER